ncbi:MAG: flagellin [Alphaproteobacteria bacterium]|nr:flagellin [Alphaproteobacteria bacterium]
MIGSTNVGAAAALQTLRSTQNDLSMTARRVGSGLKVETALDSPIVFNIANDLRTRVAAQSTIREGIDRANSVAELGLNQAESLRTLLTKMRDKAQEATGSGLTTENSDALNAEFTALRSQIAGIVDGATVNGANLINNSTTVLSIRLNDTDTTTLTYSAQDLTAATLGLAATTVSTQANAGNAVASVSAAIATVNTAIANLASRVRASTAAKDASQSLSNGLEKSVSSLVDADLPGESARLQALQTKQQLGIQALAIANQQPATLLQLFR